MIVNKKIIVFIIFTFVYLSAAAQIEIAPHTYLVYFTDKNNTEYSIYRPEEFLSEKAIQRRLRFKIPICSTDLPVSKKYIDALRNLGFSVLSVSKWLNCAAIYCKDVEKLKEIQKLSFISNTQISPEKDKECYFDETSTPHEELPKSKGKNMSALDYGASAEQVKMLNGHYLHNLGFRGEGVRIAVLDAGFYNVDKSAAFDSVWTNNQIIVHRDFVEDKKLSFNTSNHGARVFSILAGNVSGKLVGSAPKAEYMLLRTEKSETEYRVEEIYWGEAAEFADSLGADIITTSLGYSEFDEADQNYNYSQMDGKTALISQCAEMAFAKGILVVSSAGNEGKLDWKYITAPADAENVLSVGAIDRDSVRTGFSSFGPSADGRIKPNVVALGLSTACWSGHDYLSHANGTSFSCPVVAGLAACLWQAHPNLTNRQIKTAIERSADNFLAPDTLVGHGVPDFKLAYNQPDTAKTILLPYSNVLNVYPNPFSKYVNIEVYSEIEQEISVELYDLLGNKHSSVNFHSMYRSYNRVLIDNINSLQDGIYIVRIKTDNFYYQEKVLKM
ncbi:MAG: hypothetical protein CSA05_01735 [Bacteroidia bacterium]|nr:MAG: hypothetical protein CSA05_01735 [Bacteroidia bacterium]